MPIRRKTYQEGRAQRKLSSSVTIYRGNLGMEGSRRGVFVACIRIGESGLRHGASIGKLNRTCDSGRNPRLALANALAKLAGHMKHRGEHGRGAFARYR
jgi:hypothetical protein